MLQCIVKTKRIRQSMISWHDFHILCLFEFTYIMSAMELWITCYIKMESVIYEIEKAFHAWPLNQCIYRFFDVTFSSRCDCTAIWRDLFTETRNMCQICLEIKVTSIYISYIQNISDLTDILTIIFRSVGN